MKIYQCFYKKYQESILDKSFEKLDNTENLIPELREYYINKICYEKAIEENLNLWGCFSVNYKSKMNIPGIEIINKIKENNGYDIYFFNPFYNVSACYYNVWENLYSQNSKSIKFLEKFFPLLKIDLKHLYEPMNTDEMFYCCYFIANKTFWDGYNEIFSNYFEALDELDEDIKNIHNSSFKYPKDYSLNLFPFIHERFFSSYIKIKNFKVFSFHYKDKRNHNDTDKKLDELRKDAILEKNKNKLKEWINKRCFYYNMDIKLSNFFYEKLDW
jgi:hypothetical protein